MTETNNLIIGVCDCMNIIGVSGCVNIIGVSDCMNTEYYEGQIYDTCISVVGVYIPQIYYMH